MKTATVIKKEGAAPETKSYRIRVKEGFRIPGTRIMLEDGDELIVSGPVSYQQPDEQDAVAAFVASSTAKGMMRDEIVADLVQSFGLTQTDAEMAIERSGMVEEEGDDVAGGDKPWEEGEEPDGDEPEQGEPEPEEE